jgi:hypothetical protein
MHEQDDAPGTPARGEDDAATPVTGGGWATASPRDPDGPLCPWCSAPLPDPAVTRCPSCGASLAGPSEQPIPGVTAVDPEIPRGAAPLAPRKRRSVLSWITGEVDLVDVPPPVSPAGPAPGTAPSAPAQGAAALPVAPEVLGTSGPDALAPPDARVRREMRRLELEALGFVAVDANATAEEPAAPEPAHALADEAPEAGGLPTDASAAGAPAADGPPDATTPGRA